MNPCLLSSEKPNKINPIWLIPLYPNKRLNFVWFKDPIVPMIRDKIENPINIPVFINNWVITDITLILGKVDINEIISQEDPS